MAAVVVGATVVALALGLWELGDKSLWYDEGYSVGLVRRPYGDFLWRLTHWEVNQSPYYLALSGWRHLGLSEATLRALSVLFAAATVPAVFVLGRRLFDARVGAVAAVLVAVHPFAVEWAQQLRAYSMVMLAVTVATYLFLVLVEEPSTRAALAYAVVAAVAVYAHLFAGLVVLAHAASLVVLRRMPRRELVLSGAVLAGLLVPLAVFLVTREGDPLYWVLADGDSVAIEALRVLRRLAAGSAGAVPYGVACAAGLWAAVAAWRRGAADAERWRSVVVPLWLLVPPVVAVAATYTVKPVLDERFLIVVVPALAIVAAVGLCALPPRAVVVGLALLVVASGYGVRRWYQEPSYEDWRGATAAVAAADEPGDGVVVVPSRAVHLVRYYRDRQGELDAGILFPAAGDPPAGEHLFVLEMTGGGVWGTPLATFPAWLAEHYALDGEQVFERIVVRTYSRR